jgi:hypothetical protein
MGSGNDDIKGVKKDIEILKEVIDEVHDDTMDLKLRMDRLEKGQERIIGTLDYIVGKLEKQELEETSTTVLLGDYGQRIRALEKAASA